MPDDWCHIHYVSEPIPDGVDPWRVCFECNHVYVTRADALEACILRWGSTQIEYSCPLCTHDW